MGNDYLVFEEGDAWCATPEAVAEVCDRYRGVGSDGVVVLGPRRADGVLFSETQSRILASVAPESVEALSALAEEHGVPLSRIGVTGGERLDIQVNGTKAISEEVATLRETWWTAIERGLSS